MRPEALWRSSEWPVFVFVARSFVHIPSEPSEPCPQPLPFDPPPDPLTYPPLPPGFGRSGIPSDHPNLPNLGFGRFGIPPDLPNLPNLPPTSPQGSEGSEGPVGFRTPRSKTFSIKPSSPEENGRPEPPPGPSGGGRGGQEKTQKNALKHNWAGIGKS